MSGFQAASIVQQFRFGDDKYSSFATRLSNAAKYINKGITNEEDLCGVYSSISQIISFDGFLSDINFFIPFIRSVNNYFGVNITHIDDPLIEEIISKFSEDMLNIHRISPEDKKELRDLCLLAEEKYRSYGSIMDFPVDKSTEPYFR